jgi:hypothetical protein
MFFHDTVDHRQTQADAFVPALGGEKRLEYAGKQRLGNAWTGISDFKSNPPSGFVPVSTYREFTPVGHCVYCVEEKIQQALLDLTPIAPQLGKISA